MSPILEVTDADCTFTPAQKFIVYITNITATRAATLPALSSVRVGDVYTLKDITGVPDQVINLTPNGSDLIDGVNDAIPLATGNDLVICVTKLPTAGWGTI